MTLNSTEIREWSIYKITNPQGRVYIGRTSQLDTRKKFHLLSKPTNKNSSRNVELQKSINFYGSDLHDFSVIEKFSSNVDYADGKEKFWVRSYMCNRHKWPIMNGFNLTDGGTGNRGYVFSPEVKRKMSTSGKVKIFSENHRGNLSKSISRPVLQFDLKGVFIKEFPSIKSAAIELWGEGCKGGGYISEVCQGKRKKTRNFIFKYK